MRAWPRSPAASSDRVGCRWLIAPGLTVLSLTFRQVGGALVAATLIREQRHLELADLAEATAQGGANGRGLACRVVSIES